MQVAESSAGAAGAPVPFFVRRPNATDVSERLGRFPIDGLVALFQLDEQVYPKGKASGGKKLVIVPDAKSAAHNSAEQGDPDPPAKNSKAAANKSKGGKKGEIEQPRPGDGGIDERWGAIRSEVQSNRCLLIAAGESFSLATPALLCDPVKTGAEGDGGRKSSVQQGAELIAGNFAGSEESEEKQAEMGCPLGIVDESLVTVGQSSPFAVSLDFRIDLAEALLNTEGDQKATTGENGDVAASERDLSANDTIVVRILSCGNDVEVSAVLRLWAPPDAPALRDEAEEHAIERRESKADGSLASSSRASRAGSLSTGARSKGQPCASTALLSPPPPSGDGDATARRPTPTWYLHALAVRSGSFTGTVRCMDPVESAVQPPPSGTFTVCDLAEWHALAFVSIEDGGGDAPGSLCIDGDVVALQRDADGFAKAGTGPGEAELLASGAVVVGGTGGERTALAVKNLAVYGEGLGKEQLLHSTRVFRTWREEQQEAKAADAEEDERWVKEARKAEEEGREPGKTSRRRNVRRIPKEKIIMYVPPPTKIRNYLSYRIVRVSGRFR